MNATREKIVFGKYTTDKIVKFRPRFQGVRVQIELIAEDDHTPSQRCNERGNPVLPQFWSNEAGLKVPGAAWAAMACGAAAGLLLPIILVLAGAGIDAAAASQSGVPEFLTMGWVQLPTDWMNAQGSMLRVLLWILGAIAVLALAKMVFLFLNEYAAVVAAVDFDVQAQKLLFVKSGKLALQQGLSGQQSRLRELQQRSIPQVRESIQAWYEVFPRFGIHMLLLSALACSIHLWVTATALIALLILRTMYHQLEATYRKRRPVDQERWRTARTRLEQLCDTAPLLATVHNREDTAETYRSHLNAYRNAGLSALRSNPWNSPWLRMLASVFSVMFLVLLSVRILDSRDTIHLGEAFTLCAAVVLAVHAYNQWRRVFAACQESKVGVRDLTAYLLQPSDNEQSVEIASVQRLQRDLQLEHVSMRDSHGRRLLEDVSLDLKPGQITAIVARDSVPARALMELILGFGRPYRGRMLLDGTDSLDVARDAIRDSSLWISPNGPLVTGTIQENLWTDGQPDATVDLMDVARRAGVADTVLNLVDGLQTLVSPSEDRLPPEALFRLGIARGFVKKPSIVVAEEPISRGDSDMEQETSEALQALADDGAIVVVLARRVSTLRNADQIVVLHENRVADLGTHAELLEHSELYRHLNYIRFATVAV